jgi:hypothetical protein
VQIVGFGAQQLSATPQIFQALSLGGSSPVPPALLFGTPNARVVPVQQTSNGVLPLNLTLQAQSTASAIERISRAASLAGLSPSAPQVTAPAIPTVSSPPVQSAPANSTAFVGATVPNEQVVSAPVTPPGTPPSPVPSAALTFSVVAPPPDQTTTQALAQDTLTAQAGTPSPPPPFTLSNSGDAAHVDAARAAAPQPAAVATASSAPALPPPANPSLVQQVVSTVQSLIIGKIYPAPVFSFLV